MMSCVVGIVALCLAGDTSVDGQVDYVRDIKPILSRRCYSCHGALKQESQFRLDTAALLKKGGENGAGILPGNATESAVARAITGADGWTMPPEGAPLKDEEIALIQRWIDQGAQAPDEPTPKDPRDHWSFHPPVRPEVPRVRNAAWVRGPIDAFVAAEQEKHGVIPNPPTEKHVLLRRVHLDLVGLPPTREELQAFLLDTSTNAYEKVVDRLLASPHYGERWGRHWMDVWRYSDWAGYGMEVRESLPHVWKWRDWIIQSLNEDKPYRRMIEEMLAGDELAPEDPNVYVATGFLVRNWYKFNRNIWLDNTVEHTSKAFLGITMNCARCHDHMYDPITQADYYRFRAFFEPHDVRTDRIPGVADVNKEGIPRAFDHMLEAPTYLFARGDEAQPVKETSYAPGVPVALGANRLSAAAAIELPVSAYYAGMKPFVQEETLSSAIAEVEKAQSAFHESEKALANLKASAQSVASAEPNSASPPAGANAGPSAPEASRVADTDATSAKPETEPKVDGVDAEALAKAESDLAWSAKRCAAAQARLLFIQARIAADQAHYARPRLPAAAALALAAGRAERQAQFCAADESCLEAKRKVVEAERALKPDDAATKKALETAKAKLAECEKALEAARAALASSEPKYTPVEMVYPEQSTGRRTALARWITDSNNPLTARVAVNHVWMRHFGQPLVASVFDFGVHGDLPTHPELLDWLAVEFMEKDWSMKALHRSIVTSNAYRMRSDRAGNESSHANDPDNKYLWRMVSRRMEAESVRDTLLAVGGNLDTSIGGPDLDHEQGLANKRRSVYFRHAPEKQMVFLQLFDAASVHECYRRSESIVPQQGLALANSPLAIAQSRVIATRLTEEESSEALAPAEFVRRAFEAILGRAPSDLEREECVQFLDAQSKRLTETARMTPFVGGSKNEVPPSDDPARRARENLVHVLLNHHDFVTIH